MRLSLSLASIALAAALPPASPPSTVGRFSAWTNALPNGQLPHVPLLGNGALGVLLDGSTRGGGGRGSLDVWLGSASFWSCGACNTLALGCCRLVSLGGLRLAPRLDGDVAFAAEQRIGAGQLAATFTTANGGVLTALVAMSPADSVVVIDLTWAPAAGEPYIPAYTAPSHSSARDIHSSRLSTPLSAAPTLEYASTPALICATDATGTSTKPPGPVSVPSR